MPSLLDFMMQSRRGAGGGILSARMPSAGEALRARAGGLLGPPPDPTPPNLFTGAPSGPAAPAGPAGPQPGPQAASQPTPTGARRREPGPGERGQSFLSRLFTGSLSPEERQALTKEDRDRLLRQGLLTTGLAMLAGNHSGRSFGEVLARGIFAAQQDTAETAGQLLDTRNAQIRLARRAQVFESPDLSELEKWQEIRRISAKEGDAEAVKIATDVIGQLQEMGAGEAEAELRDINGQTFAVRQRPDGSFEISNPFTGEVVAERPAPPRDEKERLKIVNDLADDLRSEAGNLPDVVAKAETALAAPRNAIGDQTLIVAYNNLIDPNSIVREGEFDRTQKAGGFTAEAQAFANRFVKEGRLPEQIREQLEAEVERLRQARMGQLSGIAQQYVRRSLDAGVDPRLVVRPDLFGSAVGGGSPGAGGTTPVLFPEDEGAQ